MADGSAPMLRSGLCHGPDCREEITEKSPSPDFHNDACQARWSAAHVGTTLDPMYGPRDGLTFNAVGGFWALLNPGDRIRVTGHEEAEGDYRIVSRTPTGFQIMPVDDEPEQVDLSLGARHQLTGGEYEVTETDGTNATLTPCETPRRPPDRLNLLSLLTDPPKPIRRSWWKPNTWRRNG